MAAGEKEASPWTWLAWGCGLFVLLLMTACGALFYFGFRTVKGVEEGFRQPEGRQQAVERILHPESLPEGYRPVGGVRIPFLIDVAILSDEVPPPGEDPDDLGEHAFVFLRVASFLHGGGEEWEKDLDFFESSDINLRRGQVVQRGSLVLDDLGLEYVTYRGEIDVGEQRRAGLTTLMYMTCNDPPDTRHRFGLWVGPDPSPESQAVELDLTGTTADESAMRSFLSHFSPCT